MFMRDQELLPNKELGRHYYQVQFYTSDDPDTGIWLYAAGSDNETRELTFQEMDEWLHMLDVLGRPYRVYQFHEVTKRTFSGGSEAEGKV